MAATSFEASSRNRSQAAIIDLHGEIDRSSEAALTTAYGEATAGGATAVLLNFSDVGYINSTGIAVIVGLLARARTEGRKMTAYGLSEHYREIFEITRLSDFMSIFGDEDSAVAEVPA
jgi:anti-sigma B factor antagonist